MRGQRFQLTRPARGEPQEDEEYFKGFYNFNSLALTVPHIEVEHFNSLALRGANLYNAAKMNGA